MKKTYWSRCSFGSFYGTKIFFENKIEKVRRKIPTKTTAEILEQNRAVLAETSPQEVL